MSRDRTDNNRPANNNPIFTPIESERVSQSIERQLREAIVCHHYRAGDKLPSERELSQMFKASRLSVRDAIRSLEKSGFVTVKKGVHGGAFVIQEGNEKPMVAHMRDMLRLRDVSLEDILAARLLIEPKVAAEAARKATPEDILQLKQIIQEHKQAFDSNNPVIQHDRNPRFHRALAEITGNQVIIVIMQMLMEIHAFRMNKFKLYEIHIEEITRQHAELVEAIENKDPERAYDQMTNHVLMVHKIHAMLDGESSEGA